MYFSRNISPTENKLVSVVAYGEGWHNYHHAFPYDYKAAELGNYGFNNTTAFIDFMALIGWAYDLKTVSEPMIRRRVLRTGDGTHSVYGHHHAEEDHDNLWGWGDQDIDTSDVKDVTVLHSKSE